MGLEKYFDNVEVMFESQTGQLRYDELNNASKLCVEIAENFAIGFLEWYLKNQRTICTNEMYLRKSNKELLEIYKKTL